VVGKGNTQLRIAESEIGIAQLPADNPLPAIALRRPPEHSGRFPAERIGFVAQGIDRAYDS
jgi:hypothetical protein